MCVWGEANKERVLCGLRGTVDTVAKLLDPLQKLLKRTLAGNLKDVKYCTMPFLRRDQSRSQWFGWFIIYYHDPSLLGIAL
jgi:hypothetical protein